nr:MAG TPA: hypothetical protein [Caudoviricetes sp.]
MSQIQGVYDITYHQTLGEIPSRSSQPVVEPPDNCCF